MPVFDPYLDSLKSTIKPSNVRTHLYDYILNRVGVGPTTERFGVPNPTTPYVGVGGNYVGMDTSPGNVGRNIDLKAVQNEVASDYVGIDPSKQQVITKDGKNYVIGKDQKVAGGLVVDEDAPTGVGRVIAGVGDAWDKLIPNWGGGVDKDRDKRDNAPKLKDAETTRKKTTTDRLLDQEKLQTAIHQSKQPMYDDMHRRNLDLINQVGEQQLARDLNYLKQAYPLQQAAAWDATKRGIYGDKYSASAAQRRAAESAGAEAQMLAGIASQANAAANMRGRYAGKNISIS